MPANHTCRLLSVRIRAAFLEQVCEDEDKAKNEQEEGRSPHLGIQQCQRTSSEELIGRAKKTRPSGTPGSVGHSSDLATEWEMATPALIC